MILILYPNTSIYPVPKKNVQKTALAPWQLNCLAFQAFGGIFIALDFRKGSRTSAFRVKWWDFLWWILHGITVKKTWVLLGLNWILWGLNGILWWFNGVSWDFLGFCGGAPSGKRLCSYGKSEFNYKRGMFNGHVKFAEGNVSCSWDFQEAFRRDFTE